MTTLVLGATEATDRLLVQQLLDSSERVCVIPLKSTITRLPLLVAAVISIGCGQPKATSSVMTEEEERALVANLETLEEALREHSPFVLGDLSSAATDEELKSLRSGLGGTTVECLEVWYGWHNGGQNRVPSLLPLGEMLSIKESLKDRELTQGIPFVDPKRKHAFKLLDDGCGDGYFLDITTVNPRVFYHMLEDPFPRDYGVLQDFVAFIAEVHAAGVATKDEMGAVVFDLERFQTLESKYLARAAQ